MMHFLNQPPIQSNSAIPSLAAPKKPRKPRRRNKNKEIVTSGHAPITITNSTLSTSTASTVPIGLHSMVLSSNKNIGQLQNVMALTGNKSIEELQSMLPSNNSAANQQPRISASKSSKAKEKNRWGSVYDLLAI